MRGNCHLSDNNTLNFGDIIAEIHVICHWMHNGMLLCKSFPDHKRNIVNFVTWCKFHNPEKNRICHKLNHENFAHIWPSKDQEALWHCLCKCHAYRTFGDDKMYSVHESHHVTLYSMLYNCVCIRLMAGMAIRSF